MNYVREDCESLRSLAYLTVNEWEIYFDFSHGWGLGLQRGVLLFSLPDFYLNGDLYYESGRK